MTQQTDYYQYRITINGEAGPIVDNNPTAGWSTIASFIEDRGGIATLHRRLVTDDSILPMLTDRTGYLVLKDKVISPWIVLAEVEVR